MYSLYKCAFTVISGGRGGGGRWHSPSLSLLNLSPWGLLPLPLPNMNPHMNTWNLYKPLYSGTSIIRTGKQRRFFVDNLMLGIQLADVLTRCSSHLQGKSLSTKNLRCFSTATATENDVTIRTGSTQLNALIRMRRGCDWLPFGGVATVDKALGTGIDLPRPKLTDLCTCLNAVDCDYTIIDIV